MSRSWLAFFVFVVVLSNVVKPVNAKADDVVSLVCSEIADYTTVVNEPNPTRQLAPFVARRTAT